MGHGQGGEAHDGVHGGADIVADVAQKGALGPAGHLGHTQGLGQVVLGLPVLGAVGDVDHQLLPVLDLHAVYALLEPLTLAGLGVEPLCLHRLGPASGLQLPQGL